MTVLDRMPADELAARSSTVPNGYSGVDGDEEWAAEVRRLADLRGATLLAHNYQLPAIQDVADHVGDSLALSRIAAEAPEDTIVFCGVHFMAETAKILSPDKTVLIPDQRAGCSLADSITADDLRAWKAEYPGAVVVSYVNTTAAVKARDRHLLHVVERRRGGGLDSRGPRGAVLPGPVPRRARAADHRPQEPAHLGRRMPRARRYQRRRAGRAGARASRTPNCMCIPNAAAPLRLCIWPARARSPKTGSRSCPPAACSTPPAKPSARQVLVATEVGMLHQLRRAAPEVDFRAVNDRASCKYMKMITPAALLRCLIEGADEVDVDPGHRRGGHGPACSE